MFLNFCEFMIRRAKRYGTTDKITKLTIRLKIKDFEIRVGIKENTKIIKPGVSLSNLSKELEKEIGKNIGLELKRATAARIEMLMHFKDFDAGFQLGDYKKLKNRNQKFEKIFDEQLPESSILVNGNDEIEFFKEYFAGDNLIGGFNWLLQIVNDLPIKGTYTVPELNLKDATFKEVLEAVKSYYLQKLSTYKKRTAKV